MNYIIKLKINQNILEVKAKCLCQKRFCMKKIKLDYIIIPKEYNGKSTTEIMAEAINELSTVVNHIEVYSCYGNHMRTIQDKNESIHSDNMEKIIPWWLRQRLQNNSKVEIIESEYKEFTRLNVLGTHICAVHGDLEKDFKRIGVTINTLFTKKFGETIDFTISADKHHIEEFLV